MAAGLRLGCAIVCGLSAVSGIANAATPPTLASALRAYENLDDLTAERQLKAVLAGRPSTHQAALAHLYLGLIALERHYNVDLARAEFRKAATLDPTAEMPLNAAPKSRMVFLAVQQDVVAKINETAAGRRPDAEVRAPEPEQRSRLPAYVLGGAFVATLATAITLGVVSNQTYAQGENATDANQQRSLASQVQAQRIVADGFYLAATATGIAALVTFFLGGSNPRHPVAVSLRPGEGLAVRF
jgi:hypothetical protein